LMLWPVALVPIAEPLLRDRAEIALGQRVLELSE
jgi:hypothetical protein